MATRIALSILLASLLASGLAACGGGKDAQAEAEKEEVAVPVEIAAAHRGAVSAFYSGTTTLEAERDAEVVAKTGGVVEQLLVEEGQRVKAGQVMAKIDDARLRLEVQRAEANLAQLEQEYRRNKQLHEKQLVSAEAYERLTYGMDSLRADLELARLQLAYTEIRAPFDGIVAERYIKVGNMIAQNASAFRVTTYDPLIAKLHVPERELNKLVGDQPAELRVDALPGRSFNGTVDRVSPVVDAATGTFTVTIAVSDANGQLKPGMFGRIDIIYDRHEDAVLIPRTAVITEDAKSAVFVVRDGHAQRQVVTTGYAHNGSIEIVEGLQAGDQVITVGQNSLKDGARVAVANSDTMPDATLVESDEQVAIADQ
ncbi:MAG: efflux RND transporter periplasmic adaptor subunit [Proteobacteria bacterium]|nr:efflux RND transporter periplasmic adaptor subunit [Pseudomonadota bacterium]